MSSRLSSPADELLADVSWLRFMDESEAETSDVLMEDLVEEPEGEAEWGLRP